MTALTALLLTGLLGAGFALPLATRRGLPPSIRPNENASTRQWLDPLIRYLSGERPAVSSRSWPETEVVIRPAASAVHKLDEFLLLHLLDVKYPGLMEILKAVSHGKPVEKPYHHHVPPYHMHVAEKPDCDKEHPDHHWHETTHHEPEHHKPLFTPHEEHDKPHHAHHPEDPKPEPEKEPHKEPEKPEYLGGTQSAMHQHSTFVFPADFISAILGHKIKKPSGQQAAEDVRGVPFKDWPYLVDRPMPLAVHPELGPYLYLEDPALATRDNRDNLIAPKDAPTLVPPPPLKPQNADT